MTWTAATFKARWTEFEPTADALVESALAEAARSTDARLFGEKTDDGVGLLAAHLLSISPQGQQARLESSEAETTYSRERARLVRIAAGGPWAVGQGVRFPLF